MNFGDKVRELRTQKNMTQDDLAKQLGVSRRTIVSYEQGNSYPRHRETYDKLAAVLGTTDDYLRTDIEDFMMEVGEEYGSRGQQQAAKLREQVAALFAGGELSESEQMAFLMDLNEIFMDAKKEAKKYTPKKYRKDDQQK